MKNRYLPFAAKLQQLGLTALLVGGTTLAAHAQFAYTPSLASTNSGTYTDLTTGTVITTANNDDANSTAQNIGFTFNFNGVPFTQFVLNTNGLIRLGADGPAAAAAAATYAAEPEGGPINSTNPADVNLIMPFNFDLQAGTGTPEFRVATTGPLGSRVCTIQWKNMADKALPFTTANPTVVGTQFTNFSFQAKLYEGSNQIEFVYNAPTVATSGTNPKFITVGVKGLTDTDAVIANKSSVSAWSATTFETGPQPTAANAHNIRLSAPPDAGRTYRFQQAVANDASVFEVLALGKLPTTALPSPVYAVIDNTGTTALTNVQVTLTVTGSNTYTNTQTIAAIPVGDGNVVTFTLPTTFRPGVNQLTVTLPSDGNNGNNTKSLVQMVTSDGVFSYVPADQTNVLSSSVGVPANTAGTSSPGGILSTVFTTVTGGTVNTVRVFIADVNSVGRVVQGVVLNAAGAIVGTSGNYTITTADINTYHYFPITTPPTIAANGTFQAGLLQAAYAISATAPRYFPVGSQSESGVRTNTFLFYGSPAGGGTPQDIAGSRLMIEASLVNALATTSAELSRAVTVFPNPSASGIFTIDVQNAKASTGLGIEVMDQLGRRVYTGSARDNFATTLDLSNLAPGIYHLTVRNGSEFSSSKLAIVK